MFKALGRWFKAVGYLLTGQIDAARQTLDTNPHVIRARYDSIVQDKIKNIQVFKKAVAGLIAQQESKLAKIKTLTEETEHLERLKSGALAKAKQRVAALSGKEKDEVQADEDYQKCLNAYNDFVATLKEKQARIAELESDVAQYGDRIKEHKIQLQQITREIEKIKSEATDAVAEIITARQEKELADTVTGIADDGTAEELQKMRQMREEIKAEAKISKELAGSDTRSQEADFLEYARTSVANDEFEALVGLAEDTDSVSPLPEAISEDDTKTTLPE